MPDQFLLRAVPIGLASGLVATLVKSMSEPRLQTLVESRLPPAPGAKKLVGADPGGRPENMPPAAAIRRAGRALTGSEPPEEVVSKGSQLIHLSFGTGFGVLYALAASARPGITRGAGLSAGVGLYAATHATTLPLLGLQPTPAELPRAAVIWEAGSHLIYGVTLEMSRRVLDRLSARASRPGLA